MKGDIYFTQILLPCFELNWIVMAKVQIVWTSVQ